MPESDAVIDLLGALAYGELSAFDHLADDAALAPTLVGRTQMSALAAEEFAHYEVLAAQLTALGAEPEAAMAPFVAALETYHSLTKPSTWLESVVKAYVGYGLAADFYREVAKPPSRACAAGSNGSMIPRGQPGALIKDVLSDAARAEFAVREVEAAIGEQPAIAGRLALWGRRLVGEAISQTQHVLADRDSLMLLLVQGTGDLAGVAALITRITDRHGERMTALGLDS